MTDYNHNMGGVDLKDQMLHTYMVKLSRAKKWPNGTSNFKRLLNSTVLNSFVDYRQVTGRNIQQLLYRIQLVEGRFAKYACDAETWSVPGRKASYNKVPWLTERHFLRKVAPKIENQNLRGSVLCAQSKEKRNPQNSVLLRNMWGGPLLGRLLTAVSLEAQLLR